MKKIVLFLLIFANLVFCKDINLFYLHNQTCKHCVVNAIEARITTLKQNNLDNSNIFILNKNDKKIRYLLKKKFEKPKIIIDDNINSIVSRDAPLSLEILSESGLQLFYKKDVINSPILLNDIGNYRKKKKSIDSSYIFKNVYSISKALQKNNKLYLQNSLDKNYAIFDLDEKKYIHEEIFDDIYNKFVDSTDSKWLKIVETKIHYDFMQLVNINDLIYFTTKHISGYSQNSYFKNDTTKVNEINWHAKHIAFIMNNDKVKTCIVPKTDSLKGYLLFPMDSTHFLCRHLPKFSLKNRDNFLSVYDSEDSSYNRIMYYDDLPKYQKKDRYFGLGKVFDFNDNIMYYNNHLDVLIEFKDFVPKKIRRMSKILELDSIHLSENNRKFYTFDFDGNNIYILKRTVQNIEEIIKINKDFKIEKKYRFPSKIKQKYETILPVKTNKAFFVFLGKNQKDEWFYHKLPYVIMDELK